MKKYILPIILVCSVLAIFLYKMYLNNNLNKEKAHGLIDYKVLLTQVNDLFNVNQKIRILPEDDSKRIIHIFTTWCGCCKKEIPEIRKIAKDHKITGLVWTQNVDEAKKWLKINGNYYEKVGVISDKETVMLGVSKTPITIVLDKKGNVLCSLNGPLTIKNFDDNIASCLDEK